MLTYRHLDSHNVFLDHNSIYFCKVFLEFIYNVYRRLGRSFSLTNYVSVSSILESDDRDAPVTQISLLCPSRLLLEFSIQHLRIREHFENKDFVTMFSIQVVSSLPSAVGYRVCTWERHGFVSRPRLP